MSAVIVLILRIILVVSLYAFLLLSLVVMWRKINFAAKTIQRENIPPIRFEMASPQKASTFHQAEILIGREEPNDFVIDDETVSAVHARVFYKNNQWMIEDLHSTNGTFINEERIMTASVLVPQDIVSIGTRHFAVIFEDALTPKI